MKFSYGKVLSTGIVMLAALVAAKAQSQGTSCTPPPAGIVGWWKGDGTAVDVVSGNTGVLVNVTYTNGVVGQAFACDPELYPYGTYCGVQFPDQPAYALTNALTIEGWIRPRGDGYNIFWRGDNRPGLDPYLLSMQHSHLLALFITDANGNYDSVGVSIAYGAWIHVAATYDGGIGTLSIYTNGVLAAQQSTLIRPFGNLIAEDSPGVGIGNVNDGFNNFPFTGDIDEIALYNRALTPAEIQAIYNAGSAGKCAPETGCATYANFNSTSGLNLIGSASVTNGVLRLTPAVDSQTGDVWLTTKQACSGGFDSTFHFAISQLGNIYGNEPGGDGFTLSVQNCCPTNNSWAMGDTNQFLAVFFNTFWNWPGCTCPDVSDNSVGILVNQTYIAQTDLNPLGINMSDGATHLAHVNYNGTDFTVWVDGVMVLTNVYVAGLQPGVDASGRGWVGFTAGTGAAYENHDILDWSFCLTSNAVASTGVPAIFNFAPASGTNGAVLIISGVNFSPIAASNIVYFGAVQANILAASPTSLVVVVPAGATFGPITVTVGGLMASSSQMFEPTFNGNGSSISTGSFATSFNLGTGVNPGSAIIADLDGDGKPDIADVNGNDHTVSIFRNLSTNGARLSAASFAPRVDLPFPTGGTSGNPYRLRAVDLDGDGKLDLIAAEVSGNRVSVFHNVATPGTLTTNSFETPFALIAGCDCRFAAAADLDGDGRVDIVALNYGDKTISLFKNVGTAGSLNASSFAPPVVLVAPGGPYEVAIADLDGDGKPDLAVANSDAGMISIYQNAGDALANALIPPRVDLPTGNTTATIAVADWDGDGKLDLVAGSVQSENISVFRNVSTGGLLTTNSFEPRVDFATGYWTHTVAIADFNGDGKPDIAVVGELPSVMSIFQNTSTPGSFTTASLAPRVDFGTGWNAWGIAAGDLDGDGRPDIVFCNNYDSNIQIYQNVIPFATPPVSTFFDDFNGPVLNANWQASLPDAYSGSFPYGYSQIAPFIGAPNFDFEELDTNSVIRLSNIMGPLQRRGWSSVTNYGPGNFRYEARFNTLNQSPSNSIDGFIEIWILDAANSNRYDIISPYGGGYDSSPYFFAGSTIDNNYTTMPFSYQNNTWYRLVLEDAPGQKMHGSIVSDSGIELIGFTFGHDASAFGSGFKLAISQVVGSAGAAYRVDVAVDFVKLGSGLPPAISVQPTNQMALSGGTASFSVGAGGTFPLGCQWSFNGTNLIGATNVLLTLANVQPDQAGLYTVLVTNVYGSVLSSNAVLSVGSAIPPNIVSQTPNEVVLLGNTATFGVAASGSDPLSYFWSRNGVLIPGATNFNYSLNNAQLSDSGSQFSCLVTNIYGSTSSTNVTLKVIDTIANDLCSGAIVITNASYTNVQSTLKASSFGDPTPDCVDGFGHGVWYEFTAPVAGLLIVDTFGSDFDTGLALYTGSCDSLTEIACNDDFGGVTSQVTVPTTAGTTYFILAGGYASDAGNLVLHLNYLTPPAFPVQPTNTAVVVSSNATFSATLAGTLPMSLQWYFNNAPLADGGRISGSTNSVLNIASVQTGDGGGYFLVASNIVGVTTSSVAMLTPIILPPVFIQSPVTQAVVVGSNANFFGVVSGTPPYSYQWLLYGYPLADDGVHITGAMTSSLNISNLTTSDAGDYTLTVTNQSGSASATATLFVTTPPVFTSQPVGRSVPPGLPTTFTASASCIPAPFYQLQLNGTNVTGWSSVGMFTIAAVNTNNLGFYQVVAQNSVGSVTSVVAQLTFGPVAAWGRNLSGECLPPPGLSNVVSLAGGIGTSLAVRTDGTVVSWLVSLGSNFPASVSNVVEMTATGYIFNYALRADGTVVSWNKSIPLMPSALSNVVSVAAGFNFGMALRAEGTVVGLGNPPWATVPAGLNHVTAIACGSTHSLALRSDGTVTAWGTGSATNVPAGLTNVTAIAAGNSHSLALKANGTVVAWGSGSGTNLPAGLTNVTAISTENLLPTSFSLALHADGTVVTWGESPYGETNPPAALNNLLSVAIAAAPNHGLALVSDGSPVILHPPVGLTAYTGRDVTLRATVVGAAPLSYQWLLNGTNVPGATNTTLLIPNIQFANAGNYQLFVSNSINTTLSLPAPVKVISDSTLVFLSQPTGQTNYQAAKVTVGGVTVLGSGPLHYQWFFSTTNQNYTAVPGATNDTLVLDPALAWQSGNYYVAVSNGFIQPNQSYALASAPVSVKILFARAWGYNAVSNPPVNITNAIAVATGGSSESAYNHYLALGADGKVTAWGNLPIGWPVGSVSATNVSALSNVLVTAIAAGYQHSLALKSDGTVYSWGSITYQTNPPSGFNSVVAIACGGYHDLALKSDGTVVGWLAGAAGGFAGQFNYGQATNNPAATNVVAIAAGGLHSLALRADGTVVGWGATTIPINATNVVAIAAGDGSGAALRANGTVVQWGYGMGNYPTPPANLSNVVAISGSATHYTALRNDGTVVSWGYEYNASASNNVPPDLANVAAIASGGDHDIALFGTRAPVFTVQPWSRTVFNTATSVWFCGKCAGVQPISYQWRLNGTNIPNATNDILNVFAARNGQQQPIPLSVGVYQLVASNAYSVTASKYAKLSVVIPLAVALNTVVTNNGVVSSPYAWTTVGNAQWFGETNVTHDGVSAAQSGGIGALQETILQTTVATNQSGSYSFWWKVSSELDFDFLEFRVNGVVRTNISGEVDWQRVSIPVAAGTNILQWRYSKDISFDAGQDAGWVDQFAWLPAPPVITMQPVSQIVNMGSNVTFRVEATGGKLGYQWWHNGILLANYPVAQMTWNNVGRAQNGSYYAVVTDFNNGQSTVSSTAILKVLVPQHLGSPMLLPNGAFQLTSTDANGGLLLPSDLLNFEAQASTDLVNWVTLPNALSLTNGMLLLQDSSSSNYTARYYRIIEH